MDGHCESDEPDPVDVDVDRCPGCDLEGHSSITMLCDGRVVVCPCKVPGVLSAMIDAISWYNLVSPCPGPRLTPNTVVAVW